MAIVKCEHCGQEISDMALKCVHCGSEVIKRIECKECKKYIIGKDNICEFCGAPVGGFSKKEKKSKKKLVVILVSIVVVAILTVLLIFGFKNPEDKEKVLDYEPLYELLLGISVETEILVDDLYQSWYYGIYEDDKSKYGLSNNISLDYSDLDSSYCSFVILDKFEYSVYCIRETHKNLGHYDDVREKLDKVKSKLEKLQNNNDEKVQELNNLYVSLKSYFDIAENYNSSFNSLRDERNEKKNDIEDSINKLDLLLKYDSDEYTDSFDAFKQKNNNSL